MHLCENKIMHLAELVELDLGFEPEDVQDMEHIGQCEACFRRLQSCMTIMEAVESMGMVAAAKELQAGTESENEKRTVKAAAFNSYAGAEQLRLCEQWATRFSGEETRRESVACTPCVGENSICEATLQGETTHGEIKHAVHENPYQEELTDLNEGESKSILAAEDGHHSM